MIYNLFKQDIDFKEVLAVSQTGSVFTVGGGKL